MSEYLQPSFDELTEGTEPPQQTIEQIDIETTEVEETGEVEYDSSFELLVDRLQEATIEAEAENSKREKNYREQIEDHERELDRHYANSNYDGVLSPPQEPLKPQEVSPQVDKAELLEQIQNIEGRSKLFWLIVNSGESGLKKVQDLNQRLINHRGRILVSREHPEVAPYEDEEIKRSSLFKDIERLTGFEMATADDFVKLEVLEEVMRLLDTHEKLLPPSQTEHQ